MPRHVCLVIVVLSSAVASGQIPAGQKVGVVQFLQAGYAGIKSDLTAAAAKMPEADYGFKPSQLAETRTFAAVIAHAADGMFGACATARGVAKPSGSHEKTAVTKAAVVQALADAFAFCDDVMSSSNDATASELVLQGKGEVARSAVLIGLLAHNAEMYGISTVYLRARNLVPPGSERR
jgi:hypothetical protein